MFVGEKPHWEAFMDTAVENRTAKIVWPLGWRKVPPWTVAFLAQWLILYMAYLAVALFNLFIVYLNAGPPVSFLDIVLANTTIVNLLRGPIFSLSVLGIAWSIVLSLRGINPGIIRKLVPGALDKYFRAPGETEIGSILSERAKLTPDNVAVAARLAVMFEIRERVGRLRLRTIGILVTMGLALVGAAIIVVFAGSLTSIDATAVSNVDKVKSDLTEEQRQLARLYQIQGLAQALDQAKSKFDSKEIESLERQLYQLQGLEFSSPGRISVRMSNLLPTDIPGVQAMIDDEKGRITKLNALLQIAWEKELETQRGYNDWHYIAATAITRVGVVLIIIYLVQILIGLYRYNTRLATYYNAKQDVLGLWDGNPTSLKRLDEIIGSPKFDFGKEPKHPLEDLLKAAGSKMGAAVSRAKKVEEKVS
jgi:hypothetical protein